MTLNEFLVGKTLTSVEVAEQYGLIFNVFVDNTQVANGLDIDTSSVPSGTQLVNRTDFTLENDILSVGSISINTNDVNMLSGKPPREEGNPRIGQGFGNLN